MKFRRSYCSINTLLLNLFPEDGYELASKISAVSDKNSEEKGGFQY
jgi:hypothetical protein